MMYSKLYIDCVTTNIRIFVILILIQNVVGDEHDALTECKYKPCGSTPHVMCKYPAVLDHTKIACKAPESKGGLSSEQRMDLLDSHNKKRQKIAQGRAKGQPKAANMMKLRWNFELEEIAQRFLNSCPETFEHETCRNMLDGTPVGQNSAYAPFNYKQDPENSDMGTMVVKEWYNKVKDMKPKYVKDITKSGAEYVKIAEYSQMAWATSELLGCGYIAFGNETGDNQYYTCICNYVPSGNLHRKSTEMYKTGEPCSQCPKNTWCSRRYPGLCTSEANECDDIPYVVNTSTEATAASADSLHSRLSTLVLSVAISNLIYFSPK